ncbi:MAG: hypothetical protein KF708_00450 [Pirellulales bacterium]|nr:hypothetical protein [Pirellulales bacterium]
MRTSPKLHWIICERAGKWSAALRRDAAVGESNVVELRHPDELAAAIAATPWATVVVVELRRDGLAAALDALADVERGGPRVLAVAVAERELQEIELTAREAGAVHFVTSPRRIAELIQLGERHRARVPAPAQTLRERALAQLPWSDARTMPELPVHKIEPKL